MKSILVKWILNAVSLMIAVNFVPGTKIKGFLSALFVALVLGLLNAILKPVLEFFSFPLIILTLGLFSFVINAVILILASKFTEGFYIQDFSSALILAVVLSILSWILDLIF